ncbi:facilitated trehalose transporter Tret1-like isoform X2 [Belonocnema kinseyi]|nr:facilitated trehalose transporter Tret1-like isoform X2 [Belonocnema kinseyi]XP_033217993.1 facilitated trehalose transporter Tret1-like isoform X2 [Belonocnema kinseyi]
MTAVGYGSSAAWTSPALPYLTSETSHLPISKEQSDWIASLLTIGFVLGYLLNPLIIDRLGRKKTLLWLAIPQITSWIMIILARDCLVLYIARILKGLGYGAAICTLTVYLSEIGNRKNRGIFLVLLSLSLNIGILFVMILGAYLPYNYMNIALLCIPIFFVCTFFFVPDSLYFLQKNIECEEKKLKLMDLGNEEEEEREESKIGKPLKKMENGSGTLPKLNMGQFKPSFLSFKETNLWKLLSFRNNRRALLVLTFLGAQQAFSGYAALIFFAQQIFTYDGSMFKPEISSLLLASTQFIACVIGTQLVERIKRKIFLFSTGMVGAISLAIVAIFFFLEKEQFDVSSIRWFPIFGVVVYELMLTVGSINLFYVYQGELFTPDVKNLAIAVTKIQYMVFAFFSLFRFQQLIETLGMHGVFFVFSILCASGTFLAFITIPETRGKRLEDIQVMLNSRKICFFHF